MIVDSLYCNPNRTSTVVIDDDQSMVDKEEQLIELDKVERPRIYTIHNKKNENMDNQMHLNGKRKRAASTKL
jgi:hypothetical protein